MRKTKPNVEKKIVDTALRLAASHPWNRITPEQIAKAVKIPPAQVKKLFPDKNLILPAIVRQIDAEVARAAGKVSRGTPHDRLFEVMMARFDILQARRRGILGIMAEVKRDPSLIRILLPAQAKSMQHMLALAGLKPEGIKEVLATGGLLAVYAAALWCWERDDTTDMSRTMATLDRHLRRAGKSADILFRRL